LATGVQGNAGANAWQARSMADLPRILEALQAYFTVLFKSLNSQFELLLFIHILEQSYSAKQDIKASHCNER
jgi:hypothetical protein